MLKKVMVVRRRDEAKTEPAIERVPPSVVLAEGPSWKSPDGEASVELEWRVIVPPGA